jgi:probable F420-dependent oxidoreductase
MAYVAGVTQTLELVPSVLLLPQRPTVLAAKQAAEVSILSNGRMRVVVGIGWNEHEYAVLGANFHNRGRRLEEQIEVMKALWTQPMVTYKGRWHDLDQICINPLRPKPIPLWMGGGAEDRLLRRYAKYADGWMPLLVPSVDPVDATNRLQAILKEEGRDPSSFGLDMRVNAGDGEAKDWVERARQLQSMGADHLVINAGFGGNLTPAQALQRITDARKAIAAELG